MKLWSRIRRLQRRLAIFADRTRRDIGWALGGRRRFEKDADTILGSRRWVFLVGCNNSGTTILHDLLVDTEQFSAMTHEGQRYTRQIRMAEKRGYERVWTEYIDELQMTEADSQDRIPRLAYDWLFDAQPPDKPYLVEKTTANSARLRWLDAGFPDSYFIAIVRNGYAVSEGIRRKGGKDLERAARHWAAVNQRIREDGQRIQHYLSIRYEDLVENPRETLSIVAKFLGLNTHQFATRVSVDHLKNMNHRSIDMLSEEERQQIERGAGSMLKEYGYE